MEKIRVSRFRSYDNDFWHYIFYLWDERKNPYLKKYGIVSLPEGPEHSDVLAFSMPYFPNHESLSYRDCDIEWSIRQAYRGEIDLYDKPAVGFGAKLDYAYQSKEIREIIKYPQVKSYVPLVDFRNRLPQRRSDWDYSYYGNVLDRSLKYSAGSDVRLDLPELHPTVEAKVKKPFFPTAVPFSDEVFEYIASKIKPLHKRNLDISFTGRVEYYPLGVPTHVTLHRRRLTEVLWDDLPGRKFKKTYDTCFKVQTKRKNKDLLKYPYEYVDSLLDTKVIISPWGYGPWCIRDFEALCCGCIVIKPECSNVLAYPDIYSSHSQHLVWTDIQFNNLRDQLEYCYANLDEMQGRVDRSRKFMVGHLYPNAKFYLHWTKNLRKLLEDSLDSNYAIDYDIPKYKEPLVDLMDI